MKLVTNFDYPKSLSIKYIYWSRTYDLLNILSNLPEVLNESKYAVKLTKQT